MRIDKLSDELKALVDSGDISIRAGVELSFLSENAQAVVAEQAEDFKIDMKKAKALHDAADKDYYRAAVMTGQIDKAGAIGNMLRMQAQRAVNEAMIYLWKDE